jgi:citrate lyase subunit beta / citryl-CoA lyase
MARSDYTPIRSLLFVPGNKPGWLEKLPGGDADAVIIDLEDSVPRQEKQKARENAVKFVPWLAERGQRVYVRINKSAHMYDWDDVSAVVQNGLEGIVTPMPDGFEDVWMAGIMVAEAEHRNGVEAGIFLLPTLETPQSLQFAYEIACHPRVRAIVGSSGKGADLERAMGFQWTEEGRESLYLKSRTVLAARAAGKQPIGGLWQQVHDLEGLRRHTRADRQLGMSGVNILHPSNARVVNEVFSLSEQELAYYRGLIDAYEQAEAAGKGSVMYGNEHIDKAHVATARALLAEVARRGIQSQQ